MAEVVWPPRVVEDVRVIAANIAEDTLAYAKSVAHKIVASTRRLPTFLLSGRVVPELAAARHLTPGITCAPAQLSWEVPWRGVGWMPLVGAAWLQ